jgi:hypothetical protein
MLAAMRGDAGDAIGAAQDLMPIEEITLQVDITLSALALAALNGGPAADLVIAQIIGLTRLGHEHSVALAASWFAYGQRHSSDPHKFAKTRAVLRAAFDELRKNDGVK